MTDVFKVAEKFIEHANNTHHDKIGIIAYYGSYATGDATPESDLDLFYIPDDIKTTQNLYNSFILEGRPYEFWPISWERIERMATGNEHWTVAAGLLLNTKVLYSRSEEDLSRFNSLKTMAKNLMAPENKQLMTKKALKAFTLVNNNLGKLRMEAMKEHIQGVHWSAWQVITSCLECLGLVNQTHFNKGWGSNHQETLSLKIRPTQLGEYIEEITASTDIPRITDLAEKLAYETREILIQAQNETASPTGLKKEFKDYYPGIHEYMLKVRKYINRGDMVATSFSAALIQTEFNSMMTRGLTGCSDDEFNLYSEIHESYREKGLPDLIPVNRSTLSKLDEFDSKAREIMEKHDIKLNKLDSFDELPKFFKKRAKTR